MKKTNLFFIFFLLLLFSACSSAKRKKTQENILLANLVPVYTGSFNMGSEDFSARTNEKPVHGIFINNFYIGKYELTFNEFDKFCIATNRKLPKDKGWGRDQRPVIMISLKDIYSYCNWLSKKQGLAPAFNAKGELLDSKGNVTTDLSKVKGYRLPSEAEWEYASRDSILSSNKRTFSGSNQVDVVAWYGNNSDDKTHPVGEKAANTLGIHDMSGNVWEWTLDYYDIDFYSKSNIVNPLNSKKSGTKVTRGGSWLSNHENLLKNTFRFDMSTYQKLSNLGFRLALSCN